MKTPETTAENKTRLRAVSKAKVPVKATGTKLCFSGKPFQCVSVSAYYSSSQTEVRALRLDVVSQSSWQGRAEKNSQREDDRFTLR